MELPSEKLVAMEKWVAELKVRETALPPRLVQDTARDMELLLGELKGALILDKNAIRLQREEKEEVKAQLRAAEEALDEDGAESQEGVTIADRIAALSEDRQSEKVRAERAEEQVLTLQSELAAQKELHATTSAQLVDAIMERSTILDAKAVAEMVKSNVPVKLRSLDRLTVDGLLTLVKFKGCGGRINGVTKPEGWPFVLSAAVGSPGNMPAVEVLQGFDEQLQALGAPLVANVSSGGYVPNYQQLLHALEPFRKVAEVYALFSPPLSARHMAVGGRSPAVLRMEHPGASEQEYRCAELTAQHFETLHVALTGKVSEGW